jgi:hypothetical protein
LQTETETDAQAQACEVVDELKAAIVGGGDWYAAMLEAVRNWPLPVETVNGREYRYLVGGEAFDWLLLAERLADEIADHVPEDELMALLFTGKAPVDVPEDEFQELLGAKYKAHLNFVYGVRVEAALQMAVLEEVRKEHHGSRVWDKNGNVDEEVHQRIYGQGMADLLGVYREEDGAACGEEVSLADLNEWRYWLFKYRIKNCDPEKVASDTRKGLAVLQGLEARARASGSTEVEED